MVYPKHEIFKPSGVYRYASDPRGDILKLLQKENVRIVDFRPPAYGEQFVNDGISGIEKETLPGTRKPRFIVVPLPPPHEVVYAPDDWWE